MAEVACHREKIFDFRGDSGKKILNKKAGLPRFARNDSVTVAFGVCHREEYANGIRRGDPEKSFCLKAAFTLAEVILVIGIIGIVAALTIPQLIQNTNNKDLVSAFLKSNNVISNAYKNAKAIDNIHKMAPDDFKKTFKEYLKTVDCDTHDICLQDSMFVDFTCDDTKCTEIKVDTNGAKKPNQPGKDLFKFDITPDGIIPQGEQESCIGYDCGNYTLTYHKIFEGLTPNCVAYTDGKCKTCDDGYHLEDNKTCSQIINNGCATFEGEECTICKTGYEGTSCNQCSENYHSAGNYCYHDIANCLTHNLTDDRCDDCGHYLLNDGRTACNPKYPNSKYIAGLNKWVWNPLEREDWESADSKCQNNSNMNLPSRELLSTIFNYRSQIGMSTRSCFWTSEDCGGGRAYCIYYDSTKPVPYCNQDTYKVHDFAFICIGD